MSSVFRGRVEVLVSGTEVFTNVLEKGVTKYDIAQNILLPNGTTAGKIDLAWGKTYSAIGASTTTVIDLAGSLTDKSGTTITMAKVVCIAIRNKSSTAANYLTMGPDATNGFGVVASNVGFWADATDRNVIPADFNSSDGDCSWVVLHCRTGVTVTAGATDELAVITQAGTSANTWDIVVLGRSA